MERHQKAAQTTAKLLRIVLRLAHDYEFALVHSVY